MRKYTDLLLKRIEDGILDKDEVINAFVNYVPEDDIQDLMEKNIFCQPDELEEVEEEEEEKEEDTTLQEINDSWNQYFNQLKPKEI